MTPERQELVEQLFQQAADLPPAERSRFLGHTCGDDAEIRTEVEELLSHYAMAEGVFLGQPALGSADGPQEAELVPRRIGHYDIVRLIGEGGMGMVFEARQEHPRRTVALKLIRPGIVSREMLRRFQKEADVLGQLSHPGIAQIYEAGTAEIELPSASAGPAGATAATQPASAAPLLRGTGVKQPFFAMEFVRGKPLTEYAAARHLGTRERLQLVADVCDAVHYAHSRGVIHRDLKPANILVTDELRISDGELRIAERAVRSHQSAIPKILDFGVARVIDSEGQTLTLQTGAGQLIGTLPYMSPEQAGGDPATLDERCDVYALGVILYELLAGRLPLDVRNRPVPEAARIIREDEPSRLSSLNPMFRGDIETIVGKAIEKDKARRYASAAELAGDIRRYLSDEPIIARPASRLYQFRKFAKRHRGLVGGVASALAVLLIGVVVTSWLAVRERQQRRRAEQVAYRASIAAAAAALQTEDSGTARRSLESAPPALRGWEWEHLRAQCDDSLALLPLLEPLACIGFSADGTRLWGVSRNDRALIDWRFDAEAGTLDEVARTPLAGYSQYGRAQVRAAADGMLEVRVDGHVASRSFHLAAWGIDTQDMIDWLRIDDDGRHLALYARRGQEPVALYWVDLDTETAVPLVGDAVKLQLCALGSNDQVAYVLWEESVVYLWNRAGMPIRELRGHDKSIRNVVFSPDGRWLYSASKDRTLRAWNTDSGAELNRAVVRTDGLECLACSPDGQWLASAGGDRVIRLWDAHTLEQWGTLRGHEASVRALAFSSDGSLLVSAASDGTVRLWRADAAQDRTVLRGHTSYVYPVAFSPDGEMIASGSWDQTVRLWETDSGRSAGVLHGHSSFVKDVVFSPDGALLASSGDDGLLNVWDVASRASIAQLKRPFPVTRSTPYIAFHSDGRRIAVAHEPATDSVVFFDVLQGVETSGPLQAIRPTGGPMLSAGGALVAQLRTVSPDSYRILICATLGGKLQCQIETGSTPAFAFSPLPESPPRILTGCPDDPTELDVHDATTGALLGRLRGHTDVVLTCAFSPDALRIATAGRDHSVRLWDARTYEEIVQLRGHTSYVWSLAWAPDGTRLASGSGDHTVRIWDTKPARERMLGRR